MLFLQPCQACDACHAVGETQSGVMWLARKLPNFGGRAPDWYDTAGAGGSRCVSYHEEGALPLLFVAGLWLYRGSGEVFLPLLKRLRRHVMARYHNC